MPLISVIVPAHNCESTLEKCLIALRQSSFDDFEIIVVDDGSSDDTTKIAQRYADKVISLSKCSGLWNVRRVGFLQAEGEYLVNIDSDVIVKTDTLSIVVQQFNSKPSIGALTGRLASNATDLNFFESYKHAYMHHLFSSFPSQVNFLYGSIFAIRRDILKFLEKSQYVSGLSLGDDSELGYFLASKGIAIELVLKLEVEHYKRFNLFSLLQNDYRIPNSFAKLLFQITPSLGKLNQSIGALHTKYRQIWSIIFAYMTLLSIFLSCYYTAVILLLIWIVVNSGFHNFLFSNFGFIFGFKAIFLTFIDNLVMGLGIAVGLLQAIFKRLSAQT